MSIKLERRVEKLVQFLRETPDSEGFLEKDRRRGEGFIQSGTKPSAASKSIREPRIILFKGRTYRERTTKRTGRSHIRNYRPEIPYHGEDVPRYSRPFSNEPFQTMPKIPFREV